MENEKGLNKIIKKSYFGAFLFAVALWLYTSLSSSYSTIVHMPLIIKLPGDRAFEEPPPEFVLIEAKGTGWNLFNLIFFNNSKKIFLDLSQNNINDSDYSIARNSLLKGIQALERVELSDVLAENVIIHTGKVTTQDVEVVPKLTIKTSDGFTLVGNPKIEPKSIEIRGNDKVVKYIKTWNTIPAIFEETNKSFSKTVELSDSLSGIVYLNTKKVRFSVEIQQTAEVTFPELKIDIRGGMLPKNYKISPDFISITFRGGITEIVELNPDKISVTLNYADIVNDKTGILIPKIEYPGNLKVIMLEPRYIMNHKIIRANSLSEL